MSIINNFLPEILIATIAMSAQIAGVFFKAYGRGIINIVIVSLGCLLVVACYEFLGIDINFIGRYKSEIDASVKLIIIAFTMMNILVFRDQLSIDQQEVKIEFITLVLMSVVGILLAISARNYIVLFCALELQALVGYALTAFNQSDVKSSEAGLKYFIFGALMSALMLLGVSFMYGFSGSLDYHVIAKLMQSQASIGLLIGGVLAIAAILFKLSAAPMHFWTPDVYEGAPISALNFMATTQKLGMLLVLINIFQYSLSYYDSYSLIIKYAAIVSMFVGSLGALGQTSLKRLMAYSTILNIGYALIGIYVHLKVNSFSSLNSSLGNLASLYYIIIYVIGVIGFFACLVALYGSKTDIVTFEDLKGIAKTRKTLAAIITVIMCSMIGLPPFAGFLVKYNLFYIAVSEGEIVIAVIGILTSVIAAFYYLKVIKYMYFMPSTYEIEPIKTKSGLFVVCLFSLFVTLCLFMMV